MLKVFSESIILQNFVKKIIKLLICDPKFDFHFFICHCYKLALVVMTGISCAVGRGIQAWVPDRVVHYIAASLFFVFGLHMFYEAYKNRNISD